MKDHSSDKTHYFALAAPDEIAGKLYEKVQSYFMYLQQSGRLDIWRKMYWAYYGPALAGCQTNFTGEQGEMVTISVNQLRSLMTNLLTLTTSMTPAYDCRTSNTDHESQAQAIVGKSVVDYYLREKKLKSHMNAATEFALMYAEGFVAVPWNATAGENYGVDPTTGAVITEGDIEYRSFGPMDYVRDFTKDTPFDHAWGMPIEWVNKFEIAAKYPDFADKIVKLSETSDIFNGVDTFRESRRQIFGTFDSDEIPLFTFYHKPTDALPQGRMVMWLSDDITLFDGPIPYKDVPVYRIACAEWRGTPFGYSVGFDLLPVQEMYDSIHSTICTNQNTFGVQNIWNQLGDTMEATTLAGGLRLLSSKVKPEPLQLTQTSPESFNYGQTLSQIMETLSGINSVARGNPERDMSGAAMALLQSTAIQFSAYLQSSYAGLLEDCGTATLERLKVFAKVPRMMALAGKSKKAYMQQFKAEDISQVNRVLVDMGNPIMNTTAGKMNLADKLLETGLITTPEQYIMVMTTGQLEPLYERDQSTMMCIRKENEMIAEGELPSAVLTDDHILHIKEHSTVANSPDSRINPQIMQTYTAHVQEHITLWKGGVDQATGMPIPGMDLDLMQALNIPPPQSLLMQAQMPPPGAPSGPPNAGGMSPAGQAMNPANPVTQAASKVGPPKMPKAPPGTPPANQAIIQGQQIQ
jgi:hypothetical protein